MANVEPQYSEFCAADIVKKNLFEPFTGVQERKRNEVEVLMVDDYSVFARALSALIHDWIDGKVGQGPPTEPWDIDAVRKVNLLNWKKPEIKDDLDEKTAEVYDALVDIKVLGHLRHVVSHRRWLTAAFKFCKLIGVQFHQQLDNLIWRHDLSKYSHKEVLGYAVMFGDGSADFRQLESAIEKAEWENTLYNHYAHNPHHPEYFYPLQEDGKTRVRDKSMTEIDTTNGEDYLIESVVDMLGSRGERFLKDDPVFSIQKLFDMPERFLGRYAKVDQEKVKEMLVKWSEMGKTFLAVDGNADRVRGLFDDRQVTYELPATN